MICATEFPPFISADVKTNSWLNSVWPGDGAMLPSMNKFVELLPLSRCSRRPNHPYIRPPTMTKQLYNALAWPHVSCINILAAPLCSKSIVFQCRRGVVLVASSDLFYSRCTHLFPCCNKECETWLSFVYKHTCAKRCVHAWQCACFEALPVARHHMRAAWDSDAEFWYCLVEEKRNSTKTSFMGNAAYQKICASGQNL